MPRHHHATFLGLALCVFMASACVKGNDEVPAGDTGVTADVADVPTPDVGAPDAAPPDADAGPPDAGTPDAAPPDGGLPDAPPPDAGPPDAGPPDAGPPDAGPPDAGPPDAGPPDAGPPDVIAPPTGCDAPIFNPLQPPLFDLNASGLMPGDSLSQADGFQSSPFALISGADGATTIEFTSSGQNPTTQFNFAPGPKAGVLISFSYSVEVAGGGTMVFGVTNMNDNEGGSMQVSNRLDATNFNVGNDDYFPVLDPLPSEGTLAYHLGPIGAAWCVNGEVYNQPMTSAMAQIDRINFVLLGDPANGGGPINLRVHDLRIYVVGGN